MKLHLPLALIALVVTSVAAVAEPQSLYSATVPVADYTDRARDAGVKTALKQVVIKLTGNSKRVQAPEMASFINKSKSYLLEYGYTQLPAVDGSDGEEQLGLTAYFVPHNIDRYLRENQIPLWPLNRPPLLVWVVGDKQGQGKDWLSREQSPELYQTLDRLAAERAANLAYPLYDLEDQVTLALDKAWGFDEEAINLASKRYDAQSWLVLQLYQSADERWRCAWLLKRKSGSSLIVNEGEDIESLVRNVLNDALDLMTADFVYVASDAGQGMELTVSNVTTFSDYQALMKSLAGISVIKSVTVSHIDRDSLWLDLNLEGDAALVNEALSRHPAFDAFESDTLGENSHWRWRSVQ